MLLSELFAHPSSVSALREGVVYRDHETVVAINPTKREFAGLFRRDGAAGVLMKDGTLVCGDGPALDHVTLMTLAGLDPKQELHRLQIFNGMVEVEEWEEHEEDVPDIAAFEKLTQYPKAARDRIRTEVSTARNVAALGLPVKVTVRDSLAQGLDNQGVWISESVRPTPMQLLQQVRAEAKRCGNMQGQCEGFAGDLAELLVKNRYRAEVVWGSYAAPSIYEGRKLPTTPHTWVELEDGTILDPTREQFGPFEPDDLLVGVDDEDRAFYVEHHRQDPDLQEAVLQEDMEAGDWRAWIAADGAMHEVTGDITHAEFAHYHYQDHDDPPPDDAEEEWDVDVSFSRALDEGWIRVGLNLQSYELFTTFKETQVTPQALEGLLKTLETRHADYYFADAGDGNPKRMTLRQMTAYLTRMLVRKNVSRGRGNRTPTM